MKFVRLGRFVLSFFPCLARERRLYFLEVYCSRGETFGREFLPCPVCFLFFFSFSLNHILVHENELNCVTVLREVNFRDEVLSSKGLVVVLADQRERRSFGLPWWW